MIEYVRKGNALIPYSRKAKQIHESKGDGEVVVIKFVSRDVGSYSMLATWRMWMKEIAIAAQHRGHTVPMYVDLDGVPHGTRPFTEKDAHEMFTYKWMGMADSGKRYSWSLESDGEQVVAPYELRVFAMNQCVQWCAEHMIPITIPPDKRYIDHYPEAQ